MVDEYFCEFLYKKAKRNEKCVKQKAIQCIMSVMCNLSYLLEIMRSRVCF